VTGSCEHGNELAGFQGGESLDQLSNYWLLKRDSVSWSTRSFERKSCNPFQITGHIRKYEAHRRTVLSFGTSNRTKRNRMKCEF
jgi:hypothetical protein